MAKKKDINLEGRLVLHAWVNDLFGYGSTRELLSDLEKADEGFDGKGRSGVFYRLRSRSDKLKLPLADLERYDENVRRHLERINHHRPEPVTLRYFQHLAALYAELFLDRWSTDRDTLADELNAFAGRQEEPVSFAADDLNKLAFWMATGSGKTLLMHLNYRQFLHYAKEPPDNVLLITPNAGLTDQHLDEMRKSGISCERFSAEESGLGLTSTETVRVLEITKLTRNKKGGGESVDVESFEGRSLIFVDEGHKGAGDGKDSNLDKAWRPLRNHLAEKGFTFEYSATFGQAIQASKSRELAEEYGKAILFDYSYRHFYEDGYGKDFRILNLKNQTAEYTDLLLLGNLLSFHEQRRYFAEHREELKDYRLAPPLWVFVGSSVNKERGDVITVSRFLQRFLKNENGWAVETIEKLLRGETELKDSDDRDAFAGRFGYLKDGAPAREVFEDVLREVFHAGAGGGLHVADIKGSEGELGLKVAGAERYFGLIYIGDTSAFKKLLEAEAPEVVVEEDAFAGGLFREVDRVDSQVNVLIGARKFIEGWSSWRVSNMGLLNIGKSEGSQIIQLFGRGVRLKGRDYSLKRSSFMGNPEDHPEHIDLLETLNIFAVEANYMVEFRKYLEREGVDPGGYEEIPFPIHREDSLIDEGLYVPTVPKDREFAENDYVVLDENEDIKVNLDLSIRAESMRMGEGGVSTVAARAGQGRLVEEPYLSMLDWTRIHLDLLDYKEAKGFHNLLVPPEVPRRVMEKKEPARYNLIADDSVFEARSFAGLVELQEAIQAILRKYVDKFYGVRQQRWDSENMVLAQLTGEHPNFADYTVKVKSSEEALVDEVKKLASRANGARDGDAGSLPNIRFDRHLYQPLLKDWGEEAKVSPPGLNESEEKFISALRSYCRGQNGDAGSGRELFLLRNLTRSKGVGFFNTAGFYPDFILWVKEASGAQKVVFVEPHGMRNDDPPPYNEKVDLYLELRDLSDRIARRCEQEVFLDSYIVSATPFHELSKRWGEGWTRERFARRHVLFEDDLDAGISALVEPRDELERRISTSYPSPLASGFRSLARIVDPRDLYREQLRFAENLLAFLASVSLALLREEDRAKAGIDIRKHWSGGVSPGDWKEITQRCSKVFAGYRDVPLASAIQRLKIGSEQKGFGRDIIELIRAKNDYKHDRGPFGLEDIESASNEVQEKLRRCMEALAFFTDYPIRRVEETNANSSGGFSIDCVRYMGDRPDFPREELLLHQAPRKGGLYLDPGSEDWTPLYPFVVLTACPDCEVEETYFIDAWDRRKNTARMKSFEHGHTTSNSEVSDSLAEWETADEAAS